MSTTNLVRGTIRDVGAEFDALTSTVRGVVASSAVGGPSRTLVAQALQTAAVVRWIADAVGISSSMIGLESRPAAHTGNATKSDFAVVDRTLTRC